MLGGFSLGRYQLYGAVLSAVAGFILFVATVTPAWQVAEDLDINRYVQSGLWLYCPGAAQCWYIFSDNLINYYEKVDVCRFLLIGDCRKKLLRTPYFFGWHYAVLIINFITLGFIGGCIGSALLAYLKPNKAKIATVLFDILVFLAVLFLSISLIVFVVNAEMLESKYLIGVKNTFEGSIFSKSYGYSFYLACFSLLILTFAMLPAVLMTTFTFFHRQPEYIESESEKAQRPPMMPYKSSQYYREPTDDLSTVGYHTPLRSATPLAPLPALNVQHGTYIPPGRSPTGEFIQQTRHFYSY